MTTYTLDSIALVGIDWRMVEPTKLAVLEKKVEEAYERVYPYAEEVVVLATCNRFEIYMVKGAGSRCVEEAQSLILENIAVEKPRVMEGLDAVRHLFRVASGLESMVLGEPEILGQVKRAFEYALEKAYAGKTLSLVFRHAVKTGKRVRTETAIGKGNVGIPGAAVVLAEEVLGGLQGKVATVVGAGEAGSIIASLLVKRGVSKLYVVNRSFEKAVNLCSKLGGVAEPIPWGEAARAFKTSNVVFAALSVDKPVLDGSLLPKGVVVVDISNVPVFSNIPPGVVYKGFMDVVNVARRMAEARRSEVPKAERIIEEELEKLVRVLKQRLADEVIESVMKFAKAMVDNEVRRAISVLRGRGVDVSSIEDVLRDLAWSSARKSLRPLIVALREAAELGRTKMLKEVKAFYEKEYAKAVSNLD